MILKMNLKKILIIGLICWLTLFPTVTAQDTSKSSIVMDIDSGRILYEKNAHDKRLIASTTKILTAVVTLENIKDLNKEIEIGEEVLKMYGTNIYIEVGEKMKIIDLLYGLLLRSGNDAAVALAVAVSGSEEKFVQQMNVKAQEIGMKNSIFLNPHGLDEETKNYSTAYDMALLMKYAYQNEIYRKISGTKKITVSTGNKTYLWYNRNKLLDSYQYCTGGKNGYTPSAGKTLVTTATKDKLNLLVVTLNDGNIYTTHKNLYEMSFNKYKNYKIIDKETFRVDQNFVEDKLYIKKDFYYPLTEEELDKIKTVVSINNSNKTKKGQITIYLDNKKIGNIPIYKKEKSPKKESFYSKIKSLFTR